MLFMPTVRRWYAKGNQTGCSNEPKQNRNLAMGLELLGQIELPENAVAGLF
jgi:hypothetical protein